MKTNELMIGDWVTGKKWRENPFKLTRINDNGKYYYGTTSDGTQVGPFLLEEIEPIPLTPEILKKNGFYFGYTSSMEDSINNISHDYPIIMPEETWCWDEGDGEITIDFPTEADGGLITIEYADKRMEFLFDDEVYVHQLQHALRLCGIEKEIEL